MLLHMLCATVAFDTRGHTYFVEDGLESKNVITGNLAAVTRESFVGLSTDATPASYWLVNGDNVVANNIAAGSSHYGFWFFPESKVRGASEFEDGAEHVCPQGIPITWFDGNEAHNNHRYGLRIFTGTNHNGEGLPGWYPRATDPCEPVSEHNPFEPSNFTNMFSWRNGQNGISFGSVAALRIIDAVVADNVMRGIESLGAEGSSLGSAGSMGTLRGPWGSNKLVGTKFIGHAQDACPACDHTQQPHTVDVPGRGHMRLGLTLPASWGLTVENATFYNYDRAAMVAVGGFSKAEGSGYTLRGNYGGETRFVGTRWVESSGTAGGLRAIWRWADEHLVTDVDGTFADQPFCAGCHVLLSRLVGTKDIFPDCYYDARYSGHVCKPDYHFVVVGFKAAPPCAACPNPSTTNSYRGEEGIFVREDDGPYLKHKWRPEGKWTLVHADVSSDTPHMFIVGHNDFTYFGSWTEAKGTWASKRRLRVEFKYHDHFDGMEREATGFEAVISEDGTSLAWHNEATTRITDAQVQSQLEEAEQMRDSSQISNESYTLKVMVILELAKPAPINANHTRQLFTDTRWHRCELVPHMCATGGIRYPSLPGKNIGSAMGQWQIMEHLT